MKQDPALKELRLPSHHALLVRVLAEVRRARRWIGFADGPADDSTDEGLALLLSVIQTLEMELSFIMRKAITVLEEE